jgi:hypothetical protein
MCANLIQNLYIYLFQFFIRYILLYIYKMKLKLNKTLNKYCKILYVLYSSIQIVIIMILSKPIQANIPYSTIMLHTPFSTLLAWSWTVCKSRYTFLHQLEIPCATIVQSLFLSHLLRLLSYSLFKFSLLKST